MSKVVRDVFTMRLSEYERGLLERIAKDEGRKPTEMMREILRQYAQKHEEKHKRES